MLSTCAAAHALFLAHPTVDALVLYLDTRTKAHQTRVITLIAWGSASLSWAAGAAGNAQLRWWTLALGSTALVGWQLHIHPLWRRASGAPSAQLEPVSVAWSLLPALALVAVAVWPALLFVVGTIALLLGGALPRSAASYLASVMNTADAAPSMAPSQLSPRGNSRVKTSEAAASARPVAPLSLPPTAVSEVHGNGTNPKPISPREMDYGAELDRLRATIGSSIAIDQLERGRTVGLGSYGKVVLVRHACSGMPFALKCLNRRLVVAHNQQLAVERERAVMAHVSHPFCARLVGSFKDATAVYLLLEWCPGGELLRHLPREPGRGLSETAAAFYVSCAALALEHLHSQGVLYRDVKPENCLLDAGGYLKLCDFGFAKHVGPDGVAHTVCGTPDFMAPEVIRATGHTRHADLWSWAVLTYELVAGRPPFCNRGAPPSAVYAAVLAHAAIPEVEHSSHEFRELVHSVLVDEPSQRLGASTWDEVKRHPWFRSLDWDSLEQRKLQAPIVPSLSGVLDTRNFDVFPDNAVALNDTRDSDDQDDVAEECCGAWDTAF